MSKIGVGIAGHRGDVLNASREAESAFEFVKESFADDPAKVVSAINSSPIPIKLYLIYPGFSEAEQSAIEAAAKSAPSVQHVVTVPSSVQGGEAQGKYVSDIIRGLTFA